MRREERRVDSEFNDWLRDRWRGADNEIEHDWMAEVDSLLDLNDRDYVETLIEADLRIYPWLLNLDYNSIEE